MDTNTPKENFAATTTTSKPLPVFIFSNMRYDSPIEATSLFLAREMALKRDVYYIQYPYTYKDYYRNKNSKVFSSIKGAIFNTSAAVLDTDIPSLKKVILPLVAPINFIPEGKTFRRVLAVSERVLVRRLRGILKKRKIDHFVFINSFNFYYPGIGKALKPDLNIYQCVDPMITPYDMKHGLVSELKLVEESDMVICTSKALYDEKVQINPETYLVPNAADLSHSSKALDEKLEVHPILKSISKPVIGYFGSIERRMDYDMLKQVVEANTDKNFVFVGPVYREHMPEWFMNSANVHLPGPVPYAEMPSMLKGFDICIIPFKKDRTSATVFPLKLFEYLGAGKPVIITDFNSDLKEYTKEAVEFCSNAEEFTSAINNVLQNDSPEKQTYRLQVAKENTWEIRADKIAELIEYGLNKKK
jgi:teichuronic acid biosynthesis glycosyltransferase TuaH